MNNNHNLKISPVNYPGGLRIIECDSCSYAFAAEIDSAGVLNHNTRVQINEGDLDASHSLFELPTGTLVEISIDATI